MPALFNTFWLLLFRQKFPHKNKHLSLLIVVKCSFRKQRIRVNVHNKSFYWLVTEKEQNRSLPFSLSMNWLICFAFFILFLQSVFHFKQCLIRTSNLKSVFWSQLSEHSHRFTHLEEANQQIDIESNCYETLLHAQTPSRLPSCSHTHTLHKCNLPVSCDVVLLESFLKF